MTTSTGLPRGAIRKAMRSARRLLSPNVQQEHARLAAKHLIGSQHLLRARTIAGYIAADGELDITEAFDRLLSMGKRLALPVVDRLSHRLDFFEYTQSTRLVRGAFDIPVPEPGSAHVPIIAIDLMLTPLVAFDIYGNRLGMGGGFYDRTLAQVEPLLRPHLLGVAHALQLSEQPLPHQPWDIPLDGVLTEHGVRQTI